MIQRQPDEARRRFATPSMDWCANTSASPSSSFRSPPSSPQVGSRTETEALAATARHSLPSHSSRSSSSPIFPLDHPQTHPSPVARERILHCEGPRSCRLDYVATRAGQWYASRVLDRGGRHGRQRVPGDGRNRRQQRVLGAAARNAVQTAATPSVTCAWPKSCGRTSSSRTDRYLGIEFAWRCRSSTTQATDAARRAARGGRTADDRLPPAASSFAAAALQGFRAARVAA